MIDAGNISFSLTEIMLIGGGILAFAEVRFRARQNAKDIEHLIANHKAMYLKMMDLLADKPGKAHELQDQTVMPGRRGR